MYEVHEPKPGEVIGDRYFIEAELGRGGFGVVFRARHLDMEKEVALKVLLATYAMADATAVDRFRREARIAASLAYPNTVRVFDYGETQHGVFYLVMEFVKGKPLGELIARRGAFEPHRAVHIVRQVLYALMEAHAQGIVHRDIKPENVMIVPLAYDPYYVKVMDFGIAKMVDSDASETLTKAGLTLGTPRYMPIEQLAGKPLTPATDLYAVGLVLYELLTGHPAFEAETMVDLAVRIIEGQPAHLEPAPGVPPVLAEVVNRACAKNAADRFQQARDFLEALDAWQPEVLTLPRRDGAEDRSEEMGRAIETARAMTEGKTVMLEGMGRAVEEEARAGAAGARTAMVASHTPPPPAPPGAEAGAPPFDWRLLLALHGVTLGLLLLLVILMLARG